MSNLIFEYGSFRDPAGRIFFSDDAVFRTVSGEFIGKIKSLLNKPFFKQWVDKGEVIPTSTIENCFDDPRISNENLLKHHKIPFVIYPYEWSFYMMKDAALLTLRLLKTCLNNGFILKDGTAWNCTFYQGKMIFFDVLSIDGYQPGQSWDGYQQFCQEFLYPLLLKAYKNINFHEFFKGTLTGIDPYTMKSWFTVTDFFKPGIFKHVWLNSLLTKNKSISSKSIKKTYHLPKQALLKVVTNLINIIEPLKKNNENSNWIDYTKKNTYDQIDMDKKREFIESSLATISEKSVVLDIGANIGQYSRFLSQKYRMIACDIDPDCVDVIYKKNEENNMVTPLVLNLMNPSSYCGWNLKERKSIFSRIKSNAFLALALIHHICIANNVPLEYFISFLRDVANYGVLEWVDKTDPMVQFLLRNRKDIFINYHWEKFETTVSQYFNITRKMKINHGNRTLCFLTARD